MAETYSVNYGFPSITKVDEFINDGRLVNSIVLLESYLINFCYYFLIAYAGVAYFDFF